MSRRRGGRAGEVPERPSVFTPAPAHTPTSILASELVAYEAGWAIGPEARPPRIRVRVSTIHATV
jgi:hypothetical protein